MKGDLSVLLLCISENSGNSRKARDTFNKGKQLQHITYICHRNHTAAVSTKHTVTSWNRGSTYLTIINSPSDVFFTVLFVFLCCNYEPLLKMSYTLQLLGLLMSYMLPQFS